MTLADSTAVSDVKTVTQRGLDRAVLILRRPAKRDSPTVGYVTPLA